MNKFKFKLFLLCFLLCGIASAQTAKKFVIYYHDQSFQVLDAETIDSIVYDIPPVRCAEIQLSKDSLLRQEVDILTTFDIEATVLPDNTTNKSVKWYSTNEEVASVESTGINTATITFQGEGECDIVCQSMDGSKQCAKCPVAIVKHYKPYITINTKLIEVAAGYTTAFNDFDCYEDTCDLRWSVESTDIAKVSEDGKTITGVSAGTCWLYGRLYTTTANGDSIVEADSCKIQVYPVCMTIDKTSITLEGEEEDDITATLSPVDMGVSVSWSSSDENVATVDEETGHVKAVSSGICKITATTTHGEVTHYCRVVVPEDHSADYIDLQLPSRTLWSKRNIGADTLYTAGDYFAWGETVPLNQEDYSNEANYNSTSSYAKTSFTDANYKFGSSATTLSKYSVRDGINELKTADDAARQNWGRGWFVPTKEDFQELIDNCYIIVEGADAKLNNAHAGCRIYLAKSEADKGVIIKRASAAAEYKNSTDYLFIPFSGYYAKGTLDTGYACYYLSNECSTTNWMQYSAFYASRYDTNNLEVRFYNFYRSKGSTVRPVYKPLYMFE